MTTRPIPHPLAGERVVALSPENAAEAASIWLRRPNLFAGRALTAAALEQRQHWQAGHIAKRGQDWSPGIVDGLHVEVAVDAKQKGLAAVRLSIAKGRGLAVSGEDVVLNSALACRLVDVPVVAPAGFFKNGSGVGPVGNGEVPGQVRSRCIGSSLGLLPAAALKALPSIGILLLQPVLVDQSSVDPMDPCDRCGSADDADDGEVQQPVSFEDWRVADAVRLLWYVWPEEWRALPNLPAAQWRNALAWEVFGAEAALEAGGSLPWEDWGVPVALVALDANLQPAWIDRASVVRHGGKGREARLQLAGKALAANSRLPALWQAQIEQLAEQVAASGEPAPAPEQLAAQFGRCLPPVGLLPRNAYDPVAGRSDFFPADYAVDAIPIPVEQLDLAVRQAAGLAPLDIKADEPVHVLVPVPLSSWEPRLLTTDTIDPEFQATIDRYLLERARALGGRQGLRNERAMLLRAITGKPQAIPGYDDDTDEPEVLSPWGPQPQRGGHRNPLRSGYHAFTFDSATATFSVLSTESLYAWIYLDPDNPPSGLVLSWRIKDAPTQTAVYWGAAVADIQGAQRIGDLPSPGRWLRLSVPVANSGLPLVNNTAVLDGMSFGMQGGRASFGPAGALPPPRGGFLRILFFRTERPWFSNVLPAGARIQAQSHSDDPWEALSDNDLWTPFDPAGGVVPRLSATVPPGSGGHTEAALAGLHQHYFEGATTPMTIEAGDTHVYAWAFLDANDPPTELMLQWNVAGSWDHRAFWGRDLIGWGTPNTVSRRKVSSLPRLGEWIQLKVPIADIGLSVGTAINGMAFTLFNGCAAFAETGRLAGSTVKPWFSRTLPAGATPTGAWQMFDAAGLYAPTPGARIGQVQTIYELLNDPAITDVLSDEERAQLPQRGLAGFVDYLRARIDRADDLIDYGFLKLQTDIYRVRQLMLGSEANRLAVSPALASIAKAETAVATQAQLAQYVARIKR